MWKKNCRAWSATSRHSASATGCALSRAGSEMPPCASARRSRTTSSTSAGCSCGAPSSGSLGRTLRGSGPRSRTSSSGSRALIRLARLVRIFAIGLSYGLHEFMPRVPGDFVLRLLAGRRPEPRGQRLREAFERLGPIFVKFGQVLSTRRDLLPPDIADELAKLQDRVPPFPASAARALVEKALGRRVDQVFASLERVPVASASIAQVHIGWLKDGREIAVKVLRPGVEREIAKDLALLRTAASLVEKLSPEGRRLKPREVVAEFARHLDEELNLLVEAANASQLRRNFRNSPLLAIPEVHWDLCSERVMVMERMHGVPISQIALLREKGIDLKALARAGVEICFTQVFRDGFFHADMH